MEKASGGFLKIVGKTLAAIFSIILVFVIGIIDYITGFELHLFVFYFIPIIIFSWHSGRLGSVLISFLSASVWIAADIYSAHQYLSNFILFWNTIIRLLSFLIVSLGTQHVSQLLIAEKKISDELTTALGEIKQLSGLLPICSGCKKIRNDKGYWEQLEGYIGRHSEATFTHGMCPECMQKYYPGYSSGKSNSKDP